MRWLKPYIESFNGKFGNECLSVHWFSSLEDVGTKIDELRNKYNGFRPYYSLKGLIPLLNLLNYKKIGRNFNC